MTEEVGKTKTNWFGAMAGYISLFVAGLSLVTALYQGYLNTKYIEIIQKNVVRGEYMRTCKDIIDAYCQIKLRVALLAMGGPTSADREAEAANAVNHFAALGTYLANMQGEEARVRYTQLSRALNDVVNRAKNAKADETDKLFGPADELFAGMNNDCVRTANAKI
jgi:uncharacterized membrane protein YccC